jgi:outer membrane protein assembly factor BamB
MYQLTMQGDRIVPRTLFRLPASVFGSDQRTAIFYQGHVYGVAPSEQMVCLDLDGKKKWASGASAKFGIGPYMVADGMLLIVDDSGDLTLAEASSAGWKPIAKVALFENGQEAWGPLALAGGRLLVRDLTRMICVDLRKDQH